MDDLSWLAFAFLIRSSAVTASDGWQDAGPKPGAYISSAEGGLPGARWDALKRRPYMGLEGTAERLWHTERIAGDRVVAFFGRGREA